MEVSSIGIHLLEFELLKYSLGIVDEVNLWGRMNLLDFRGLNVFVSTFQIKSKLNRGI